MTSSCLINVRRRFDVSQTPGVYRSARGCSLTPGRGIHDVRSTSYVCTTQGHGLTFYRIEGYFYRQFLSLSLSLSQGYLSTPGNWSIFHILHVGDIVCATRYHGFTSGGRKAYKIEILVRLQGNRSTCWSHQGRSRHLQEPLRSNLQRHSKCSGK